MTLNHIGFIMDGNRRYGKKNKLSQSDTYKAGMEKFLEFIYFQTKYKIKETSFYALSEDNYKKRPIDELKSIFNLIKFFSENKEIENFLIKNKVKINIKGNVDYVEKTEKRKGISDKSITKALKKKLNELNDKVGEFQYIVNIAFNYDGQSEIVHSFKKIYEKIEKSELSIKDINEKVIKENLYFNGPSPQIIVRSGDAPRLSGFMLWDSKYSEIYLTKKLWPELNEADFIQILDWYKNINRNFGK